MGLGDVLWGPRCDMCGQRGADVGKRPGTTLKLCTRDSKALRRADRSGGRSTATGRPPQLARGVMGGRYVGPEPKPQRRSR